MGNTKQWRLGDNKSIRRFGEKITFQRRTVNDRWHRSRGVTVDESTFLRMDDASIVPGYCQEICDNIFLNNNGKHIQLTKYCLSSDSKCCNGGFFNFTELEWQYFWTSIREDIVQQMFL